MLEDVVMSLCVAGVALCDIPRVWGARPSWGWSCLAYGKSRTSVSFSTCQKMCSCCFAWQAWHFVTFHTLYFTLHTPHNALTLSLHTSHSTLHTLHSRLYTLHSTHYTPHIPHFTLHTLHVFHTSHFTPHFTLHTPHSPLHTSPSTLHTLSEVQPDLQWRQTAPLVTKLASSQPWKILWPSTGPQLLDLHLASRILEGWPLWTLLRACWWSRQDCQKPLLRLRSGKCNK